MKIIALMPVKNEAWVLKTTLPAIKRFVDEIIVLDGHSTDETAALVRGQGGTVILQEGDQARYSHWRQTLLNEARARGGTHLVWLDADEALTSNFLPGFRERLARMKPGQKLILDWLCLWKDARRVRADNSVWSVNPKDFIFCDDKVSAFSQTHLHEGRTPGPNTPDHQIRIPREQGAVLHFQFVPFDRFQIKQAYIRCLEWVMKTAPAWEINEKYAITRDDPEARTVAIPEPWLEGITGLDDLKTPGLSWHYQGVLDYFERYGIAFFEPIDIWGVPAFRDLFQKRLAREPQPAPDPSFVQRMVRRVTRRLPVAL